MTTVLPELTAPWSRIPLVNDETNLFPPETQDALDLRYALPPRLAPEALTAATRATTQEVIWTADRAPGYDVARALEDGETFAPGAQINVSGILQRAYNDVRNNPARPDIWIPDGAFRLDQPLNIQPSTSSRSPGLIALGSQRTSLVLGADTFAAVSGYGDKNAGTAFRDIVWKGFTVDCYAQVETPYASKKGFNVGHIFGLLVEDVFVNGSHASAFGLDFIVDGVMRGCGARDAGRGVNINSLLGFGSSIGTGHGMYPNESLHVIDFVSENARRMGANFEYLTGGAYNNRMRVILENFISRGDAVGVGDLGLGQLDFRSGDIGWFKAAGIVVGPGGQATIGGRDGHIGRAVTIHDGAPGSDSTSDQDIFGANAIHFRGDGGGGYNIDGPVIRDNAGAPVYMEPGFRKSKGNIRVSVRAYRNGRGADWRSGGQMERGVTFEDGYYEENNGPALDLRSSFQGIDIRNNTFVSKNGKQTIAVRWEPTMVVDSPAIDGNRDYDTATWIDGSAAMMNPVLGVNRHMVTTPTDPGLIYFDPLTSTPTTTTMNPWWNKAAAGAFAQTVNHVWEMGRYGAEPRDGGAGNSGASLLYGDAGRIGYKVGAWIDPPTVDTGRRGIVACYDPVTGDGIVFENYQGSYQAARYTGGVRAATIGTFGSHPSTERAYIEILVYATGNTYDFLINGEVVKAAYNTSLIAKTRYAGMFGLAQLDGWINSFSVRQAA